MTDSIFGSEDPEPQPPSEKEIKVRANLEIILNSLKYLKETLLIKILIL